MLARLLSSLVLALGIFGLLFTSSCLVSSFADSTAFLVDDLVELSACVAKTDDFSMTSAYVCMSLALGPVDASYRMCRLFLFATAQRRKSIV